MIKEIDNISLRAKIVRNIIKLGFIGVYNRSGDKKRHYKKEIS